MERHETTDGQPLLTDIGSIGEARDILEDMGIVAVSQGVLRIYSKDFYTGAPRNKGYVHVHFFGPDGREVAYYTPCTGYMLVFKVPRTWDPEYKLRLESP